MILIFDFVRAHEDSTRFDSIQDAVPPLDEDPPPNHPHRDPLFPPVAGGGGGGVAISPLPAHSSLTGATGVIGAS